VVTEAFEKVGENVDLVVVAVGLLGDQFAQENDATQSARVAVVNFAWPVAALAEVRRRLVAQGSGRILVMSSVAAIRIRRNAYLYGGAKAGLDRLCEGMADSLDGTGVRLQLLRPGVVRTRMAEDRAAVPFTTDAEEVAGYVIKGLATNDRVIWSPPILRYAYAVLRHLPKRIWSTISDR
jgi:decaprenylphospho-beta-D-erythro-pentofuranosid-2-ulose 2-reductase